MDIYFFGHKICPFMSTNNSRLNQQTSRIYSFYIISRARRVALGASAPVSGILSDTVSREAIPACVSKHPRPVSGPQTLLRQLPHDQLDLGFFWSNFQQTSWLPLVPVAPAILVLDLHYSTHCTPNVCMRPSRRALRPLPHLFIPRQTRGLEEP